MPYDGEGLTLPVLRRVFLNETRSYRVYNTHGNYVGNTIYNSGPPEYRTPEGYLQWRDSTGLLTFVAQES